MNKAAEWGAKARVEAEDEAENLTLPSGMVIKARKPGPALVAGWGRLPLGITTRVLAADQDSAEREQSNSEAVAAAEFMRDLLVYCVVEPRISLHPTADEIHPRNLPNRDVEFIFIWALRGKEADRLATFRNRPAGPDGSADRNGEVILDAAERPSGDRGPADSVEFRSRRHRHLEPIEEGS